MSVRSLERQVKRELRRESFPRNNNLAVERMAVASFWHTLGAAVIAVIWGGTFWVVIGTAGVVFIASLHYSAAMAEAMSHA